MTYSNLQIFTVELVGTFILVIFATGSIVYDAEITRIKVPTNSTVKICKLEYVTNFSPQEC